ETDYHEALVLAAKKVQIAAAKYGKDAVAIAISDRYTNEEAYALKKFADVIGAKTFCFNNRQSGLKPVLGVDASPNTMDELLATEVAIVFAYDVSRNPVLRLKLRQAAQAGVKVILVVPEGMSDKFLADFAWKVVKVDNETKFLKCMAKALLDMGKAPAVEGFEEFKASFEGFEACEMGKEIAEIYANAKKAMLVYQQNVVTVEAATLIADLAVLSGHIGSPRDGILQIKAKNNSQGLVNLGITAGAEALEGVKALMIFGEDPDADLSGLDFLMVSDTHMTATAEKADVILPGTGFAATDGTFTNTEGRVQAVNQAIYEDVVFSNWELGAELAHVFEVELPWEETFDIADEMIEKLAWYRDAELGEAIGGQAPAKKCLVAVGDAAMTDPVKITDNLMNMIGARLPKPGKK
ncbi:MAG: molybdopterin-dependent oxidoreductase, partial [Firmicutes bacterium]|nr:molybdopterin-dependent oxidoreductase [Bacillota bacterium]